MSASTARSNSDGGSSNVQTGTRSVHNDIYVYGMRASDLRNLCVILDEQDLWQEVAAKMGYQTEIIDRIKREARNGSPSEKLIDFWGDQNHKVTELFMLLNSMQQYQAMECIREYVDVSFHRLISKGLPNLSILMKSEKLLNRTALSNDDNTSESSLTSRNSSVNYLDDFSVASQLTRIPYDELKVATGDWNPKAILGSGGFGIVFRGKWKMTDVAIKRIEYRGHTADEKEAIKIEMQQILNELKHLNNCRHDNVLPLYGWSYGGAEPCLVYQLMTGGSVESRMANKRNPLNFRQRVNIAIGTATGLQFLHTFSSKPLIHGDIKPANILLDSCCMPKIGDFGLAREGSFKPMQVSKAFGTKPFLPGEFLRQRILSTKVDTYSFGVVLFVLMTGLRPYDGSRGSNGTYLADYIANMTASPTFDIFSVADKLMDLPTDDCASRIVHENIIKCGLVCTKEQPEERPEMVNVLEILQKYT